MRDGEPVSRVGPAVDRNGDTPQIGRKKQREGPLEALRVNKHTRLQEGVLVDPPPDAVGSRERVFNMQSRSDRLVPVQRR